MKAAPSFERAVDHHRAGRLAEAERLYRDVLADDPSDARAAFLLGSLALSAGRPAVAAELFQRATALVPDNAAFHANLGEALRRLERRDDAMQSFLRALALKPDLFEAVVNFGLWHQDQGDLVGALVLLERAADLRPDAAAVRSLVDAARKERDRRLAAGVLAPPSGLAAAGIAAVVDRARQCGERGSDDESLALFRRAIDLDPRSADAHNGLGAALARMGRLDEAIASFRQAAAVAPHYADAHANLGNVLARTGLLDEALDAYRRAMALDPQRADIASALLFLLPFHPRSDALSIRREACAWDRRHAARLAGGWKRHSNDPSPGRRLRIGYVSPDFNQHCQAFFTIPVLKNHDHADVEVFCYSSVSRPDNRTAEIRGLSDHWRDIQGLDDEAAAHCIREDRIDVLVDLTMHMGENRILVFARKPAPLQVCWLAYPGTTGLGAMDYRVTDRFLDPARSATDVYAEQTIRLPDSFWCYDPLATGPPVGTLPATRTGRVTFGCLNNFAKVTSEVVALWARVLREVSGSLLILMAPPGRARASTLEVFAIAGVGVEAIAFVDYQPRDQYLATYGDIDLCLDTFPSNGHTTSLDAFWMGVPVVTLVGSTVVGRAGLCQAMNLGLPELVATTADEFVATASRLARELEALGALRAALRGRMTGSPLMNGKRFARNLEAAYRAIWRRWCAGESPETVDIAG